MSSVTRTSGRRAVFRNPLTLRAPRIPNEPNPIFGHSTPKNARLDNHSRSGQSNAMADGPSLLPQVLREEFQALRPGADITGATESELYAQVHRNAQPLSALCISGGGIRSATFALGAIQGLAEQGLLDQFDYLS